MKEFSYQIEDENGLHARPAGKLATCAKRFASEVRVCTNGKTADGKRLLSLMSLGAVQGSTLEFCIFGEDEEEASRTLEGYCGELLKGGADGNRE